MKTLEEYMSLPYVAVVTPDEDMEGKACYRAEHPQLPGCMSHGKTPKEAVQNLQDARRLYIQTRLELKLKIPVPAVLTVGTSYSATETRVLIPVASQVVSVPVDFGDVETNLPSSYDVMAEKAA
jgi:predicted RNase H-like HicB family nuclease